MSEKCRLVTRSDFDGLVCAVLLKELELIDDITFVHPKDMQDGTVEITGRDITTNLPYVDGVYLAFDHHESEIERAGGERRDNHIIDPKAPSAARVVYDYYGGPEAFPRVGSDLMAAVDKGDAADFTKEEILNPQGWVLLNFLMDARTGLGRFRQFRISNYQLMMELIDYCRDHTIEQIMELPDVRERWELYFEHADKAREQLERAATLHGNLVEVDLRDEDPIWPTNRFTIYALYPQANISMHIMWGKQQMNTVFAVGKSILNKTSNTDVGSLMLEYGGGGHGAAGTCQVENEDAERVRTELIERITTDG